jgi:hypothetical protein
MPEWPETRQAFVSNDGPPTSRCGTASAGTLDSWKKASQRIVTAELEKPYGRRLSADFGTPHVFHGKSTDSGRGYASCYLKDSAVADALCGGPQA